MNYTMTTPCDACPFLKKMQRGFTMRRLYEMASEGQFHCHKTGDCVENEEEGGREYVANENSVACAGALIFLEKRNQPSQMMRICERFGKYDRRKLDMKAKVR